MDRHTCRWCSCRYSTHCLPVQDAPFDRHAAHLPLSQMPLQHFLSAVQEPLFDTHAAAQVPLEQLPLQHCSSFLHRFPLRLQPGGSAAASPMPTDASVPPTTAAPI